MREVTSKELKELQIQGKKVLLDLYGSWCGPCKMLNPIFEKDATENKSEVQMYSMDVDLNREVVMSLGVRSVPTIKVFNGGEVIDTKVGVLNESQINNLVTELING